MGMSIAARATRGMAFGAFAFASAVASADDATIVTSVRDFATRTPEPPELIKYEGLGEAIYSNDRIYLLGGGSPDTDLKFQISFKARIAYSWFLGYTQMNHWDIAKASAPFRDTTHRPSLFHYKRDAWSYSRGTIHLAWGYEHESNGRDGDNSRSIDKAFIRPTWIIGKEDEKHWRVAPKVFAYVTRGSNNRDIADYRGYADLSAAWRDPEGLEFALLGRVGKTGRYGSVEAGTSYPISKLLGGKKNEVIPGFLYLQVFYGYGETLLDYNVKVRPQFRIGYLFDRGR